MKLQMELDTGLIRQREEVPEPAVVSSDDSPAQQLEVLIGRARQLDELLPTYRLHVSSECSQRPCPVSG